MIDAGIRGWIVNTTYANYWRVADFYDFDDLVSDGILLYLEVLASYGPRERLHAKRRGYARNQKHLMSLFQTTFRNHIHDLANKRTRRASAITGDISLCEGLPCSNAELDLFIAEAPELVRRTIRDLMNVKPGALSRFRQRLDGTRETTRQRLRRTLNCEPEHITAVHDYLTT